MFQRAIRGSICFSIVALTAYFALAQQREAAPASSSGPDIVGIRPGISAQEAYNLLKARNASIKIGVGQSQVPGLGDKPIVNVISAEVLDARAPEIITLWLTLPPARQVVYAIGRRLQYPPDKPLLRENVINSLRQKYGQEASFAQQLIWVYDRQQGKQITGPALRFNNYCLGAAPGNLIIDSPDGATFTANTVLMNPPQPESACNSYITVKAVLGTGTPADYTPQIDLLMIDLGLSRQAQVAYQDYLRIAANAKAKEDLEKAKQRKGPVF